MKCVPLIMTWRSWVQGSQVKTKRSRIGLRKGIRFETLYLVVFQVIVLRGQRLGVGVMGDEAWDPILEEFGLLRILYLFPRQRVLNKKLQKLVLYFWKMGVCVKKFIVYNSWICPGSLIRLLAFWEKNISF